MWTQKTNLDHETKYTKIIYIYSKCIWYYSVIALLHICVASFQMFTIPWELAYFRCSLTAPLSGKPGIYPNCELCRPGSCFSLEIWDILWIYRLSLDLEEQICSFIHFDFWPKILTSGHYLLKDFVTWLFCIAARRPSTIFRPTLIDQAEFFLINRIDAPHEI